MAMRTRWIEELSESLLGEEVTLAGWIKTVRKMGAITFFELRERTGVLQLRADAAKVPDARNEYVVSVTGILRKKEVPNPKMEKGDLELEVTRMEILNRSEPTPFPVKEETEALEDTRLQYRYLDLRRHALLRNLEIRAKICSIARDYFEKNRFLEVETPILNLATPEGARDYLVPSRTRKGCFYALPQSPQLFKQLLMVGGIDRYYQIARCFRDEDLRADRQPEFTQIDVEMSFMSQEEVLSLAEGLFQRLHREILGEELTLPLRRIPYWEALDRYGSDKPDTRYGLELQDLSFLLGKGLPGMEEGYARGILVPASLGPISRKKADELGEEARKMRAFPLLHLRKEGGALKGSVLKLLGKEEEERLLSLMGEGDTLLFLGSKDRRKADFALGAVRSRLAKDFSLVKKGTYDLLWVVDFPMFTKSEEGEIVAEHHPFTRPRDEDLPLLEREPEKVLAYAYDIVMNGYEAGGGTLRIYDHEVQDQVFRLLGLSEEERRRRFGWFLDAFRYGAPPHGGFALGLDRLAMLYSGTEDIREVIAFPKNLMAVDRMSDAPGPASPEALEALGIKIEG